MVAATAQSGGMQEPPSELKVPLIVSGVFHVVLVILAITGLPYFANPPEPIVSAIPIEILPIAEMTQTTKPAVKAPTPPEEKPPEVKPLEKEKPPTPPKVEEVKPPEPPKPKKAEVVKPKAKPVTPPPPDEAALEKTKVEPKPEEKKPPEPVEAKEKAEEQDQSQDFNKLLKNLQESEPVVEQDLPQAVDAPAPAASMDAPVGPAMTMDELAALRRQLQNCWSIQAGARYAENLVVEVRLIVASDRRVISATIVDQWRYGQDSYFRAAADSAIRAVNSPQCEVLELNPQKYDQWKDMIVTFDPRDML